MKHSALAFIAVIFFGCSSTKDISGVYQSNWGNYVLTLKNDNSFTLSVDSLKTGNEVTGNWTVNNKMVKLEDVNAQDSSQVNYWTCSHLRIKGSKLERPLHCEKTHRFLTFNKNNNKLYPTTE